MNKIIKIKVDIKLNKYRIFKYKKIIIMNHT